MSEEREEEKRRCAGAGRGGGCEPVAGVVLLWSCLGCDLFGSLGSGSGAGFGLGLWALRPRGNEAQRRRWQGGGGGEGEVIRFVFLRSDRRCTGQDCGTTNPVRRWGL